MAHNWYAIQTHSGSELTIKRALEQLSEDLEDGRIEQVLVPTEDLIDIKKGKKKQLLKNLCILHMFSQELI